MESEPPQSPRSEAPDVHPGLPGTGLWGWLGRQIGHVRHAIKLDVAAPTTKTIYRDTKIAEQPHPEDPSIKLRRTVIDEVVVDEKKLKE